MVKQYGAVPAKGTIPLQDKLRQSEEALAAAQKTIAEQQVREQELRKLLELNSLADGENSTANALLEAKTHALHNIHSQKVRALMKSIHQLQEQVATMKTQDKEHRRSALIQSLRKKQREQDLLVDVLKETLQAKVSEFQDDPNLVNEFILKKTISGPKRFRPKTREELELEFAELDKKYKRTLASLKKAKTEMPQTPRIQESEERTPAEPGPELVAMQKELETLRVAAAAKEIALQAQQDQIDGLRKRLEELHLVEDKLERTKTKYSASKEAIKKLQDDAIRLIQDKECESERRQQLEAELAFYKEATDTSEKNGDKVKMELMERVKALHAREAELLTQLEDQQRKWAQDRTTILAQMRTQENHVLSIEAQSKQAAEQVTKLVAERDTLKRELDKAKEIVDKIELEVTPREPATLPSSPTAKERALQEALDAKDETVKALEKQIVAAKLLSRQQKKEKETLLVQMDKLRTLVASTAPPTDASRVIAQATTKQSTDATATINPESAAKDDAVDTSRAEPVE
ncbi:unnamed protein product [Aphanomyces euteiches]|uniref:Uncharacterized protein n=1 Tax=Aphanomyces euteiches TaxID=100861 RepID=A0A6G0XT65_9STRA|nr:hypothetical protein Ae201684_001693 [Aphanomyces euteiches]KAH9075155.1 hypothetical protein Ae201684P_003840 [Aphanomyces euteiches]KAH9154431.1 hypothetical protein AeRB84_003469 [Aphanomyces euteiches]